jgi:hypothetical protein
MKVDVQQEWEDYRAALYGTASLSPVQYEEVFRAFFAGMLVGLRLMEQCATAPDERSGLEHLEDMRDQVLVRLASLLKVQG